VGKFHFALRCTEAHAGHGVGDDPQPACALEVVFPMIGLVAIHVGHKIQIPVAAQDVLHFAGECLSLINAPLRQQTRVHHDIAVFHMQQALVPDPVQQLVPVGSM